MMIQTEQVCDAESVLFHVKFSSFDCTHLAHPYPVANVSTFSIDLQGSCCISCCLSASTHPLYIVCVLLSEHENRPI